jgi:DNA-binding NtrC family response regulator
MIRKTSLYARIMAEAANAAHRVAIEEILKASGRSVKQAAKFTETTPGAIYKRMKQLRIDRRQYTYKPGNAEWQRLGE